jgi:uncharacterized protein YdeI (YjbR/CyaY-like superfamily)
MGRAPRFFATPAAFRAWLQKHHASRQEVVVGYYKRETGRPTMTWSESVDQALCFGWIDGIRRKHDEESYTIRFTPRRPGSNWSGVNIAKMAELERQGQMTPAGRAAFDRRIEEKSRVYSYEDRHQAALDPASERAFRRNRKAWTFFQAQPPGYRQTMIFWVMDAAKPETRERRLERLIATSAAGRRVS